MLNPLVAALAGRRHFPIAAQIHHVGRRTGTPYVTSVGARVHGGIVLIPLTFGNRSDWARNVYAAGRCSVRINGADYQAVAPQFLTTAQAAPSIRTMFRPAERLFFKVLGIRQFIAAAPVHPLTERSVMQTLPIIERPAWLSASAWPWPTLLPLETGTGHIAVTDIGHGPTLLFVHVGTWRASFGATSLHVCRTTSVVCRSMRPAPDSVTAWSQRQRSLMPPTR